MKVAVLTKNLALRLSVAAAGIPLLIVICILHEYFIFVFGILLAGLGGLELALMFRQKGYYANPVLSVILPVLCIISAFYDYPLKNIFLFSFFLVSLIVVKRYFGDSSADLSGFFNDLLSSLLPVFYLGLTISFVIYLRKVPDYGGLLLIYIFLTVWGTDTAAYFGGKAFGKRKFSVLLSPNKTWAGFYSGFFGAVLAGVVSKLVFLDLSWLQIICMSILACFLGQAGDLLESGIKRHCQVKDSSSIIPGHGGVLDRFDSFFFAVPAVYIFVIAWK